MRNFLTLILILSLSLQACRDQEITEVNPIDSSSAPQVNDMQKSFAKILASALNENVNLREFIKKEALKEFDNDYDVLYQLVKDTKVDDLTFHEILLKYSDSKEQLLRIEENLPLLTIFVPELPDFSAKTWNVNSDVPQVAVSDDNSKNVLVYNHDGEELVLEQKFIPAFPVVVVKKNERIILNTNNKSQNSSRINASLFAGRSNGFSFSFSDDAFNGIAKKPVASLRKAYTNQIDQRCIDAYFHGIYRGLEWHRDYVYYNLVPRQYPYKGKFKNDYSEFIASFKLSPSALYAISDQGQDPILNTSTWTDGNFEFRVNVLINAINGVGSSITKVFSAKVSDLYNITLKKVNNYYQIQSIYSKEFYPNIELVPWDLNNYSIGWKFIFNEFDASSTIVQNISHTSKHATNFGFDFAWDVIVKLGFKFGESGEITTTQAHSITTNLDSDFLGEATLTFDQPIIIGYGGDSGGPHYTTREITTGSYVSVSVEPKKVY